MSKDQMFKCTITIDVAENKLAQIIEKTLAVDNIRAHEKTLSPRVTSIDGGKISIIEKADSYNFLRKKSKSTFDDLIFILRIIENFQP